MAVRPAARALRRKLPSGGVRFDRALAQLGAHGVEELALVRVIQNHIQRVLDAFGRSRTVTAAVLGVHRRSLQRMLARGIHGVPGVGGARSQPEAGLKRRLKELTAMKGQSLEERIKKVVTETAQVIAEMVRADLAEEVQQAIAKRSNSRRDGAGRAITRSKNAPARRLPPHCIFPSCNRPHKGPRFSFLCDEHMGVSKADKAKYLQEWKVENAAPAKKGASKRQPGKGTSGRLDEATVGRVLRVVEDSPGLRSEQIYEKLTLPPALTKRALAKLREDRRVKTKGERRAMTYALA